MSRIRCAVAMSLDGFIAGPQGESDWIVNDPEVDFAALWGQFDSLLMGRRTYEAAVARLGKQALHRPGVATMVVSRTWQPEQHADLTVLPAIDRHRLRTLRAQSKKDVWLLGGGELFRSLLALGEVDSVEVSVMPVLLGGGVRLLPDPAQKTALTLTDHRVYRTSGIVSLTYRVRG